MNLSFNAFNLYQSAIVNTANGYPLYHTETHNIVDRTTKILKVIPGMDGAQELAEIHWETLSFHSAKVIYRGVEIRNREFLQKHGIFSDSRTFTAGDGRQYKWKADLLEKFKLLDQADNVIVESHYGHLGLFGGQKSNYNLNVNPAGMHILDDIIVTFLIMKKETEKHREREAELLSN
ncbi:hypothetical protein M422DRAFT_37770 [Sphaerobolus stellatus SS14]|uniref:DUF6593 domain-containing protein n=1 Tax=Sphaerobolus stellatus (strain SS14) TaxID=990650 RepID=A0A0C9TDY2_SPHS4|nr:hypothetical protein M422DRAFT_37770 [Sphaerobolus stellatus SS14]